MKVCNTIAKSLIFGSKLTKNKVIIRSEALTKKNLHNIKVAFQIIYGLMKNCDFMIIALIHILVKIGPYMTKVLK